MGNSSWTLLFRDFVVGILHFEGSSTNPSFLWFFVLVVSKCAVCLCCLLDGTSPFGAAPWPLSCIWEARNNWKQTQEAGRCEAVMLGSYFLPFSFYHKLKAQRQRRH